MSEKTIKITEFNYELLEPITYAHKGNPVEASFITFKAPSSRQIDLCSDLKQYFFQSLKDGEGNSNRSSGESPSQELDLSGSEIMILMAMSTTVKLKSVILTAKQLFKVKGIAQIDGSVDITDIHFNEIDPEDIEEMVGEYLVNFILASALKKMKKDSLNSART